MQKKQINYLGLNTISYLGGPILFTAPHSKRLLRGGKQLGENTRTHLREQYTSYLTYKIALLSGQSQQDKQGQSNSFMFWGKFQKQRFERDLDPNYLNEKMLPQSPFHQSLHKWALASEQKPLFHVDIHGKMNRKNNCEIDVGIDSMEQHWGKHQLLILIKEFFETRMNPIFKGLKFRNFQCKFNTQPYLSGYWGGGIFTLTQQAIKLGIPSLQFEIPFEVRQFLFKNEHYLKQFANGIRDLYKQIICVKRDHKILLKLEKSLAQKYQFTIKSPKDFQVLEQQIKKEQIRLNSSNNIKKI